jgi:hypothetical protein
LVLSVYRFSVLGFVALHVSGQGPQGANGIDAPSCSTVDHECLKLVRKVFILDAYYDFDQGEAAVAAREQ